MKNCALCKSPARTYCESDQAILCWDCDAKVHGANFLVARHSRSLLCNDCKSPTAWKASGAKLGRTVSVCERCAGGVSDRCEEGSAGENDEDLDTDAENDEDEEDAGEYDDSEGEEEADRDEEEGENQVVPWSSTPPPPPAACLSSSEDDFSETVNVYWRKRMRENRSDLHSPVDADRFSSHLNNRSKSTANAAAEGRGEDTSAADSLRSLKSRKTDPERRPERGGLSPASRTVDVEN